MIDDLEIRRATPDDLEPVVDLLAAQMAEHDIPIDRAELAFAAEGLLRVPERGAVLAAVRDGTIVGIACLSYSWALERGGTCAWLDELYVLPPLREHGIGNRLVAAAVAEAGAAECLSMELEVETSHARAEHLYLRHGFQPLPRRRWTRSLR